MEKSINFEFDSNKNMQSERASDIDMELDKQLDKQSERAFRTNMDLYSYMQDIFQMQEVDIHSYSPLTLAYIGDSIYDLVIKSLVINKGNKQVHKLHKETSSYVQASAQSLMMRKMQEYLTEEEHAVYKRGRNAKSVSPAKNQSLTDYRRATGFEALLGYLYLKKEWKRMLDLIKIGLDSLEVKEE